MIGALLLAAGLTAPAAWATPDTALLSYESGVLVGVDWIQRRGATIRTLSVLMQSATREAQIELGASGTARSSSTIVTQGDAAPGPAVARTLTEPATFWSDQIPSTIELVIARAIALGERTSTIAGASLYRDARTSIAVERIDTTSWVLRASGKRYEVLADGAGRVLSVALPDYGVTIERRTGFTPAMYPRWSPYAAAPGASYRAEQVRIPAPQGHSLAGTLTLPPGRGPFAATVLITGLSPHERNNGDPPWMPFRDIADALVRKGIAVLRVDDRGVGLSTGDRASSTTSDEADDVEVEVRWLAARAEVDRHRIALLGYSEGGLIAPMVAARDSTIASIVMLAGPGVPGPEVARYQITAAVMRDSSIAPAAKSQEIARQLADSLTVRERSYLAIDPPAYAARVRCPALILHGATDLTVPPRSAQILAQTMRGADNRDVTVRLFPGVSHAFLPDPIGLPSGWAALPGFMTSPEVLRTITDWLSARLAPRSTAAAAHR